MLDPTEGDLLDEEQPNSSFHSVMDEDEDKDHDAHVLSELTIPLLHQSSSCDDDEDSVVNDGTSKSWVGPLLLLFVSFLFATLNVSLRSLYLMPNPPSPSALSVTRGWLTLGFFVPFWFHRRCNKPSTRREGLPQKSMWRVASELAFWNFFGQALYNWGILYCSSARASFLGQTTVVMVPLICALGGETLRCWDGMGCFCSLIGLILLSMQEDNTTDENNSVQEPPQFRLGTGDVLILSSTVCWSFYLIKTSQYAHVFDGVYLQGSKNALLALLYSGWFAISWIQSDVPPWQGWQSGTAWAILIYSALGPGVMADLIQQKGQASAGATESNLILCMESLFTAFLGRVLLGEETSWIEKLGGAFLIAGALVSGR